MTTITRALLTLFVAALWLAPTPAPGASRAQKRRRAAAARCEVEGVRFKCPRGLTADAPVAGERMAFFRNKQEQFGLFVAVPPPEATPADFAGVAAELAVRKYLPAETQPFRWRSRQGRAFATASRYDVFHMGAQGFNGDVWAAVRLRFVKFGGRGFLVGYVFAPARGKEAADGFARGGEVESMPGCHAAVELVYSVTGEKLGRGVLPCELSVETPGGV